MKYTLMFLMAWVFGFITTTQHQFSQTKTVSGLSTDALGSREQEANC